MIQCQLLLQLVERALEERGGSRKHRASASPGDTRGECGGMFFRDTGIDVVGAGTFTKSRVMPFDPGVAGEMTTNPGSLSKRRSSDAMAISP